MLALNEISLPSIKTKQVSEFIKRFELKSALIIVGGDNENLLRSSRNMPNVKVLKIEGINVYDILKYDTLVMTEESLARAQEVLAN
jgi:large subunit ribosomal protein L4